MFGSGSSFRPLMGELRLHSAPAPSGFGPQLGQAAPPPATVPPPTPPPPPPVQETGIPHGTQMLIAGGIAALGILGAIFFTD